MKFTTTAILDGVILCEFESRKEMCLAMCRMQEFYESPYENIKGKKFSHEDFMNTYMDEKGNIDYCAKWGGFNIPEKVLCKWLEKHEMSKMEKQVIDSFLKVGDRMARKGYSGYSYLIAAPKGCESTLKHEIAHALYSINKEYKKEVNCLLKLIPIKIKKKMTKKLLEMGYCKEVIDDEIHAYIATSNMKFLVDKFGVCYDDSVGADQPFAIVYHRLQTNLDGYIRVLSK